MAFKSLADMSSRNVYDFSHEQKAVVWLRVVQQRTCPPIMIMIMIMFYSAHTEVYTLRFQ